jgi:hypothetical protein
MPEFTNKPFFIPKKEVDLIDSMNEELIDDIIGQSVDVYKISVENTNDNVYGESNTYFIKIYRLTDNIINQFFIHRVN